MEGKSVKEITDICVKKVNQIINNELPLPQCPVKAAHCNWKRNQVKEDLSAKLSGTKANGAMTIKVEI